MTWLGRGKSLPQRRRDTKAVSSQSHFTCSARSSARNCEDAERPDGIPTLERAEQAAYVTGDLAPASLQGASLRNVNYL